MFYPKSSSDFRPSPKVPPSPPPPYRQSTMAPVLVTETTTRTEVVTTTTTETTTHLFSMPYWRKRTSSQPTPPRGTVAGIIPPMPLKTSASRPLLIDKALPPTPPDENRDFRHTLSLEAASPPSPLLLPTQRLSRDHKISNGMHSASALAQAALGVGLPCASSPIPHRENSVTLVSLATPSTSSLPSLAESPPRVRRVKSSQKIEATLEVTPSEPLQRRRRGFSFGTTTFLGIGSLEPKSKGKEPEKPPSPAKSSPKPLSRKSSFWTRRNSAFKESTSSTPTEQDLPLPSLPPVNNVSPFGVDFPTSPSPGSSTSTASHGDHLKQPPSGHSSTSASPRPSLTFVNSPQSSHEPPAIPVPIPRLRAQTNSPLLHRLSMAVFSSPEPSPVPSVIRRSPSSHFLNQLSSPVQKKPDAPIPKPLGDDESPEIYLERLKSEVSKAEVAGILASSSDPFYTRALQAYFRQFEFASLPLDVALRRLLMEVGLPRETQQIDRVMEAFASRYRQCNPNLFTSEDHPYILAFSLIMLHTDAFNPSNKRKMTKADYIKNTKLPGIPTEVLDCFFDNIVFAPFIFIEDPVDFDGQLSPDVTRSSIPSTTLATPNSATTFKMGNRVDPYYLIMNNLLDPLRADVARHIPLENPFSYEGTNGPWDESSIHDAFMKAYIIKVEIPSYTRPPTIFNLAGSPNIMMSPLPDVSHLLQQDWSLKITKISLLNRKDDFMEGGKKALNRKWRTWTVILTGSQLLLCRDPTWVTALRASTNDANKVITATNFRPDEVFSLKDALAVYDRSYTKYNHTFRFLLPDGRHFLLQASNDEEMNRWIACINYASTFKTAGVRMRPPGLSGEDVHLTGVAAATSHLHDIQGRMDGGRPVSWGSNAPNDLMDMLTGSISSKPQLRRRVTLSGRSGFCDTESIASPEIDGAEQFKATFDQVKADLATKFISTEEDARFLGDQVIFESPPASPESFSSSTSKSRLPSRSQIVLSKIQDLDARLASLRTQLDSDERFARSIAILTPFRKTTRSRLQAATQSMSRAVMEVRLEVEKLKCHRAVLRGDLVSEGKTWSQSKRVALMAAKDTLLTRRPKTAPQRSPVSPSSPSLSSSLSPSPSMPSCSPKVSSRLVRTPPRPGTSPILSPNLHRLTDSEEITRQLLKSPGSLSTWSRTSRATTLSSAGSFYSAQENPSMLEWPASPNTGESQAVQSRSSSSPLLPKLDVDLSASTSSILSHVSGHGENVMTPLSSSNGSRLDLPLPPGSSSSIQESGESSHDEEEQAEEWNKTRVAKRVSLIQVPSDIAITKRLKGHNVTATITDDE